MATRYVSVLVDIGYQKNTLRICCVYKAYIMGIVKISDQLHEEIRKASAVMLRSINSQAEFWMKIGMLAEKNPQMSFNEIINELMKNVELPMDFSAEEVVDE